MTRRPIQALDEGRLAAFAESLAEAHERAIHSGPTCFAVPTGASGARAGESAKCWWLPTPSRSVADAAADSPRLDDVERILLAHPWGLGDFLMLLPAFRALSRSFRDARVDLFLGQPHIKPLVDLIGAPGDVLSIDLKRARASEKVAMIRAIRRRCYDLALCSTGVAPIQSSVLLALSSARYRVGARRLIPAPWLTHVVRESGDRHQIATNNLLAEVVGCAVPDRGPSLRCPVEALEAASAFLSTRGVDRESMILVHAGNSRQFPWKRWPVDRFARLLQGLAETDPELVPVLVAGPDDTETLQFLQQAGIRRLVSVATGDDLPLLIGLAQHARLVVSNDSGVAHLAAALGTATLTLFAPTNPLRSGPSGPFSLGLAAPGCPHRDVVLAPRRPPVSQAWRGLSPEVALTVLRAYLQILPALVHHHEPRLPR